SIDIDRHPKGGMRSQVDREVKTKPQVTSSHHFTNCDLTISPCLITTESKVIFKKIEIMKASGLSSNTAIPEWIVDCQIKITDSVSNSSIIKSSQLPASQKLFYLSFTKYSSKEEGEEKKTLFIRGGLVKHMTER
ncbi:hypothetical protein, partial [Aeromonas australiensis]|uniref:hypothetical protein n=1 Tax=Aeromonas australiensis TaxID=1114880 RepID=UPI001F1F3829